MTSQRERGRGEKKLIILQTQVGGGGGGSDGKEGATEWQTGVIPAVIINLNPRNSIRRRHNPCNSAELLETCLLHI